MDPQNPLVEKTVLHSGNKTVNFVPGTRVTFHFLTKKSDESQTILDDSRKMGKPMVLVLGKKFKLEVWENMIQMMSLNEVAKFRVDKTLVTSYPFVSKALREVDIPLEKRTKHCCGVALQGEGVGFDDLNELLKAPVDLEFTIELMKVESPDEYEKEAWQLNEVEKLKQIPVLKKEGNDLYKEEDFVGASDKYALALGMLEQLMLNEKPGDTEWLNLEKMKMPLLLNYSQCKLLEKDYYKVIEHCSEVILKDPENVKALFRRGKAHIGAWNPFEAKEDLGKVIRLDPSLKNVVKKELAVLEEMEKEKDKEDKERLKGKMFS